MKPIRLANIPSDDIYKPPRGIDITTARFRAQAAGKNYFLWNEKVLEILDEGEQDLGYEDTP